MTTERERCAHERHAAGHRAPNKCDVCGTGKCKLGWDDAQQASQVAPGEVVAKLSVGSTALGKGILFTALTDAGRALPPGKYDLFTRATDAAAAERAAYERAAKVCEEQGRMSESLDGNSFYIALGQAAKAIRALRNPPEQKEVE